MICPRCLDAFEGDAFYCSHCDQIMRRERFEQIILILSAVGFGLLCVIAVLSFVLLVLS